MVYSVMFMENEKPCPTRILAGYCMNVSLRPINGQNMTLHLWSEYMKPAVLQCQQPSSVWCVLRTYAWQHHVSHLVHSYGATSWI